MYFLECRTSKPEMNNNTKIECTGGIYFVNCMYVTLEDFKKLGQGRLKLSRATLDNLYFFIFPLDIYLYLVKIKG